MARYLEMSKRQQLESLIELGWRERRIARELGIHRKTVRRYAELHRAKCTQTPTEPEGDPEGGAPAEAPRGEAPAQVRRPFLAAAHHDEVLAGVKAGDSAQGIYQDLVEKYGYAGSYDSVKRYVRHLKAGLPRHAVGVMHHAPGEERIGDRKGLSAWGAW